MLLDFLGEVWVVEAEGGGGCLLLGVEPVEYSGGGVVVVEVVGGDC